MKKNLSEKIHELINYLDLGYVLDNMESLIELPVPYKTHGQNNDVFENNRNIAIASQEKSDKAYCALSNEAELRKTTFKEIRQRYPDFCQNMIKKVPENLYAQYIALLKSCLKDITKLVSSFKSKGNKDYKELLLEKKDSISALIDSETISRLTYFQDAFVLSELNSIDYTILDSKTQDKIKTMKEDLIKRIDNYRVFQNLYSKYNHININLKHKPLNTEERE